MELPDRYDLEAKFAGKLSGLTSQHRRRLRELMGNPPNPANVPPAFWDEVRRDMDEQASALLYLLFLTSAGFHATTALGITTIRGGNLERQLDNQAETYGRTRALELATSYAATAREAFADKMAEIRQRQEAGEKITRAELNEKLAEVFGPAKAESIARTETTGAQSAGGDAGIEATVGTSTEDLWLNHPELSRSGPCPTCKPLHNSPRSTWAQQFPGGPPCHTGCVCSIKYANLQPQATT